MNWDIVINQIWGLIVGCMLGLMIGYVIRGQRAVQAEASAVLTKIEAYVKRCEALENEKKENKDDA